MAAIVVFPFYAFACMNFPVDNIFCPFYPYPRKAFSVFAEILPIRGLEPTCEPAVEVRERARFAYGTEHICIYIYVLSIVIPSTMLSTALLLIPPLQ